MHVSISLLVSFILFSLLSLLFPFTFPLSLDYHPFALYSCFLFSGHFWPPLSLHITGPRCEVPVASCFRWPIVRRVHTCNVLSLSALSSHHPLPIVNKSLLNPNQLLALLLVFGNPLNRLGIARLWINPPLVYLSFLFQITRSIVNNTAFVHHSSQPAT